ncbi:hypothetical protein CYMTET_4418 [Cymbomonas tetramitiformis]|uniref:Uncharacterized protein n=1 Tax=Cymbomonas tetramitiformis TaxID=36881 RepID=A0AAE0H1F4_9CHLO|nr:hypothetical protein CYMTET_4418 [Cymbomonas tetramitiformis]
MISGKPKNTTILYEKLVDELLELWEVGFPCWDSFTDDVFQCRAMLLAAVFDYVGLVDAMNIMGVGSFCACAKCLIRGKGKCPHLNKMLYKFCEQDPPGPAVPKTDEFIRRAGQRHVLLSTCKNAANLQEVLEEEIGETGVKFPSALSRLPYFDLSKNVILDGMHQLRNLGLYVHEALMGFDFTPGVREHARANDMHPTWWKTTRDDKGVERYSMAIGPFQIPMRAKGSKSLRSLETALKFMTELSLGRSWGQGHTKMLRPNGTNTGPKTLKCHKALKMLQAGIMSVLASWDRDEGYSKNMLEDLIGQLTVITRELTSELVDSIKDVPKLQNLVDEFFKSLKRDGSPDWLVINTHLLSHFPDQLLMYVPIRGTWMYVFESINGKIRRGNHMVRRRIGARAGASRLMDVPLHMHGSDPKVWLGRPFTENEAAVVEGPPHECQSFGSVVVRGACYRTAAQDKTKKTCQRYFRAFFSGENIKGEEIETDRYAMEDSIYKVDLAAKEYVHSCEGKVVP